MRKSVCLLAGMLLFTGCAKSTASVNESIPRIEVSDITVSQYADFDYSDYVKVYDAFGRVTISQSSVVDTSTIGDKKLTVTISDDTGNIAIRTIDVHVIGERGTSTEENADSEELAEGVEATKEDEN